VHEDHYLGRRADCVCDPQYSKAKLQRIQKLDYGVIESTLNAQLTL
jgi:hypothetical protein